MRVNTFSLSIWVRGEAFPKVYNNLSRRAVWRYLEFFNRQPNFWYADIEGKDLN